jgi:hypothetical protein
LIPLTAHFVWLGRKLPWVYVLGVLSAARRGGFERVILHHADELEAGPNRVELEAEPRVELQRLDPLPLLEATGGVNLVDCYRDLVAPASRVNLIRLGLLTERGGVYLDTDTVTLGSFAELAAGGGVFCGQERLVFPGSLGGGWASRLRPGPLVRTVARDLMRRAPSGYRLFRRVERFYPTAANNAVLGAEAQHPFLRALLDQALALPRERRRARYAFGTHLLQAAIAEWRGPGLRVLAPAFFYPLGPEISEHWFRARAGVRLEDVLGPETLLVHWYASVRTERHVAVIDRAFTRVHAGDQLFSALAERALALSPDAVETR